MNNTTTDSAVVIKLTAESQYWFDRCQQLDKALEEAENRHEHLLALYETSKRHADDYNSRLNLIAEFHRVSDKIGYRPAMNPGAVTANALEELIRSAKDFKEIVSVSDVSAAVGFQRPEKNPSKADWQKYAEELEQAVRQLRAKYNRNGKR